MSTLMSRTPRLRRTALAAFGVTSAGALLTVALAAARPAVAQSAPPAGDDAQGRDVPADPESPVAAGTLLPLAERSKGMKIIDGQGEGRSLALAMSPVGDGLFELKAGDLDTLYLQQDEQGAINIVAPHHPRRGQGHRLRPAAAAAAGHAHAGDDGRRHVDGPDLRPRHERGDAQRHGPPRPRAGNNGVVQHARRRGAGVPGEDQPPHQPRHGRGHARATGGLPPRRGDDLPVRTEFTIEKMGMFGDTTTRTLAVASGEMSE